MAAVALLTSNYSFPEDFLDAVACELSEVLYIYLSIYLSIYVCVCVCVYVCIYIYVYFFHLFFFPLSN